MKKLLITLATLPTFAMAAEAPTNLVTAAQGVLKNYVEKNTHTLVSTIKGGNFDKATVEAIVGKTDDATYCCKWLTAVPSKDTVSKAGANDTDILTQTTVYLGGTRMQALTDIESGKLTGDALAKQLNVANDSKFCKETLTTVLADMSGSSANAAQTASAGTSTGDNASNGW